jgi:signal transduction histidine kinase
VNAVLAASDASVVYVFPNLQTIDAHGMITSVLDPQAVHQAVQTGRPAGFTVRRYQGEDYLVYTEPLVANGQVRGAVQTSISEHQYESARNSLIQNLLLVALLGLIISGGISVVLVRRALQPIRLAMQRQRDFVADAAHELRTPLAIMRTVGEVGMSEPSMDELQATIAQMLGENQHLTRLVEDLSLLARTDTDAVSIERRPVDLSALVAETAAELQPLAEAKGVQLQTEVAEHVRGLGDILRLRQLLLILLDNALKHTPEGGSVSVRLFAQGDRARLQVADSGPGIDPADLPHIFNRFYRADRARTGEGTGLGLAIGKWITEAHGGQIHAANAAPHGAVFTVTLPIARHALAS